MSSSSQTKVAFLREIEKQFSPTDSIDMTTLELSFRSTDIRKVFSHKNLEDLSILQTDILAGLRPLDMKAAIVKSLFLTRSNLFGDSDPISGAAPLVNTYLANFTVPNKDMEILEQRVFQGGRRGIALVVGGEIGSGKTIFSAHGARDVPRLYLDLRDKNIKNSPPELAEGVQEWATLLRALANFAKDQYHAFSEFLHDVCRDLNAARNTWAKNIIKKRLERCRSNEKQVQAVEWILGERYNEVAFERVLLVVDEVSRSMKLVHALIECRDDIFPNCPAKSFGLVLCGTSLEMLHKSGDGQFSVGSNPASSEVVSLDAPNLLDNFSNQVSSRALHNGVYTSSFLSNARIVSKALLPYFYSFYGYQNVEDEEQSSFRQEILGSRWECRLFLLHLLNTMDYAIWRCLRNDVVSLPRFDTL